MESPSSDPDNDTGLEDSMGQLGLGGGDPYPERPSEPDCKYYLRNGSCGYGARCKYNHPRDRGMVEGGGEYPERVGEPVCEYYMKTRYCKFGATCKFHHPRYEGGSTDMVSLNYHGYPLRLGEKECSYYMKTGRCNFGVACKFHHPQPSRITMPASAFYPLVQPPSVPSPMSSWQVVQPLLPGSYVQGPHGQMMVSPGMFQISSWSPYLPPTSPGTSPITQHAVGTSSLYGLVHQLSPFAPAYTGPYTSLSSSAGPSSSSWRGHIFPERPDRPECRSYLRTGNCKYGSECKYYHPPEWSVQKTMGQPLRPGTTPPCPFYVQYGECKFGATCKYDHPMGMLSYTPSASSLSDMPVAPDPVGTSMGTLALPSSSDLRNEITIESSRESFLTKISSPENMSSSSVGLTFSKGGAPILQAHAQLSCQSSAPLDGGGSTSHVSENPN